MLLAAPLHGEQDTTKTAFVEIRSYNLKPGSRDRFHQTFLKDALPMLRRWKVDVVSYGPSLHDKDSYFLMRGFAGIEQRQQAEDAFYAATNGSRARASEFFRTSIPTRPSSFGSMPARSMDFDAQEAT